MTKSTTSKKIDLPSGGSVRVRKIVTRDWLKISKEIPDVLKPGKKKENETDQDKEKNMSYGIALNTLILTDCMGKVLCADGTSFVVVAKHIKDVIDGEVTVDEFSETEDGAAVVQSVMELSGLTPAVAEAAKPFSEQPETVEHLTCSGV